MSFYAKKADVSYETGLILDRAAQIADTPKTLAGVFDWRVNTTSRIAALMPSSSATNLAPPSSAVAVGGTATVNTTSNANTNSKPSSGTIISSKMPDKDYRDAYKEVFNREPDKGGLEYWKNSPLTNKADLIAVLKTSKEYLDKNTAPTLPSAPSIPTAPAAPNVPSAPTFPPVPVTPRPSIPSVNWSSTEKQNYINVIEKDDELSKEWIALNANNRKPTEAQKNELLARINANMSRLGVVPKELIEHAEKLADEARAAIISAADKKKNDEVDRSVKVYNQMQLDAKIAASSAYASVHNEWQKYLVTYRVQMADGVLSAEELKVAESWNIKIEEATKLIPQSVIVAAEAAANVARKKIVEDAGKAWSIERTRADTVWNETRKSTLLAAARN